MPDQLYYAAKVDGTGDMKYLFKVLVPICRPTLVTITKVTFKVIECWNSSRMAAPDYADDANCYLVSERRAGNPRKQDLAAKTCPR